MGICFITSEIFWGKRRGGFGKLVRVVGRELVKRGCGFKIHLMKIINARTKSHIIAFTGTVGSDKSTQMKLLTSELSAERLRLRFPF